MSSSLKNRLNAVYKSLEKQKLEFEEAAKCCVEIIQGMNERLERIEKWMESQEKVKH